MITKVTPICRISELFYVFLNSGFRLSGDQNPLSAQGWMPVLSLFKPDPKFRVAFFVNW